MGANTHRLMSGFADGEVPNDQAEFRPEEEASVDELTHAPKKVFSSSLDEAVEAVRATVTQDFSARSAASACTGL